MRHRSSRPAFQTSKSPKTTFAIGTLLAFWLILLLSPQEWLAARGFPGPIGKLHFLPMAILAAILVSRFKAVEVWPPFVAYASYAILSFPFAYNPAEAQPNTKLMVVVGVLMLATFALVRHGKHLRIIILTVLLVRFAWFGLHGLAFGTVRWHPLFGNQDGFGSIMAMGVGAAGALAIGATEPRLRWVARGTALLCMGGLVSSFARGAFLVGLLTLAFFWFRAKGRRLAALALVIMVSLVLGVAGSFFTDVEVARGGGSRSFWSEISSISETVADTEAEDRRLIWRIGWQVFLDNPVFGTGAGGWSAYAARTYSGDILGDRFSPNPDRIWGRAMHNIFLQELAEGGIVGFSIFIWMIVDFWRRNAALREKARGASLVPGIRTKMVALSLELSMVALLGAGMLYNVINAAFYGLLFANVLLHRMWLRTRQPTRYRGRDRLALTRARG